MIVQAVGQVPRLIASPDMKGEYYLVGVEFDQLTTADEEEILNVVNVYLQQKIDEIG